MFLNTIHLLMLCQFVNCKTFHRAGANSSEKISMTVKSANHPPIDINLIKTETFLANENIPMWIGRGSLLEAINSKKVMVELGPFITYHDLGTSSAAVYFHKRYEFEGTIDYRYFIKKLSIHDRHNELQVNKFGPVQARSISGHHFKKRTMRNIDHMLLDQLSEKKSTCDVDMKSMRLRMSTKIRNEHELNVKLREDHPEIVYIETMVIVNYDMVETLQQESQNEYISIVSYLLTLFNSVDMLYSKVKHVKIKFNIAGIIIGLNRKSFAELAKCYRQTPIRNVQTRKRKISSYLDAYCTVNSTNDYLATFWKVIPRESYDIAIFLTRYSLYVNEYDMKSKKVALIKLGGSARRYPTSGYYAYKVHDSMYVPSASITDLGNFSSFPIIAHETAHLFGVKHDDLPAKNREMCSTTIMKIKTGYCKTCLSWSNVSTNYMYTFFSSSPDRCVFMNKPRSLTNPVPQQIWTVDEQCQCYEHDSHQKLSRTTMRKLWRGSHFFCDTHLHCKVRNGTDRIAPIPMDGTPCGRNKVCWNKDCKEIGIIKSTVL